MFGWRAIFENFDNNIENFIYLEWAAIPVTMIILSRRFIQNEHQDFVEWMGERVLKRYFPELFVVTIASVCLGISCWALLVFLSAQIDADWAYRHWHFAAPTDFDRANWLPNWIVLYSITTIILGPIMEEIVFRGFVLRRLQEKHSLGVAIVISSLIFGFFHLHKNFLGSFFHGVICALVTIKFASLYAAIFVHAGYNAMIVFMERFYGFFLTAEISRIGSISYWLPELALLVISLAAFFWYWKIGLRSLNAAPSALIQVCPLGGKRP
nr:CPBP family intramembrane glutamic endopeptidase [Massilia mucilaginosa]